ncbi:MAG: hypothetical protein RIE32_05020 [Phycisphaerales bacterium]
MRPVTACVLLLAAATQTLAQYAILFDIEDDTLLPGQSTSVTLSAAYAPHDWAFALVLTDLVSSEGERGLSDWELVAPLTGPGTTPGAPSGTGIDGILAGQLNFPVPGLPPPTNPIDFWTVTYTAPMDVAAPFDVLLSTDTSRFEVYPTREAVFGESRLDLLAEGNATIRVIPTPASVAVLGGLLVCARRRHSSRGSSRD